MNVGHSIREKNTSFMDRCVNCPLGREGKCSWVNEVAAASWATDVPDCISCDEWAMNVYSMVASSPCVEQKTYDGFMEGIDAELEGMDIPDTPKALYAFLAQFLPAYKRTRRMKEPFRKVLMPAVYAGIEQALLRADLAYLLKGQNILSFLQGMFSFYNRHALYGPNTVYEPDKIIALIHDAKKAVVMNDAFVVNADNVSSTARTEGSQLIVSTITKQFPGIELAIPYFDVLYHNGYLTGEYVYIRRNGHPSCEIGWAARVINKSTNVALNKLGQVWQLENPISYADATRTANNRHIQELFKNIEGVKDCMTA